VISAVLALAVLAAADAPPGAPVSIQRADDAPAVIQEASLRLRSELAIAGYSGQIVACTVDAVRGPVDCPQKETQDSISLARLDQATSIFATSVQPGGRIWQRSLRVTDADGGSDASLLAVRAVELLRDVQIHLAASADDPEDPTPLEPFAQGPAARRGYGLALLAGISVMTIPWTTQVRFFPVFGANIGAGIPLGSRAYLVAEAAGPYLTYLPIALDGIHPIQDRPLYQFVGFVSLRALWSSAQSGPFAAIRTGLRLNYIQLGAQNLLGGSDAKVGAVVAVGAGYTLPLTARLSATLEAHLDLSPTVEVDDVNGNALVSTGVWSGGLDLTVAIGDL
jgi:hypothetical protein